MSALKSITNLLFDSKENQESLDEVISIYDIKINSLQGKPINFSEFKGKHLLFVNVASKCGFTPQYKDLQKLHDTHSDKIAIIGVSQDKIKITMRGIGEQ